jgi:hypothetical protein
MSTHGGAPAHAIASDEAAPEATAAATAATTGAATAVTAATATTAIATNAATAVATVAATGVATMDDAVMERRNAVLAAIVISPTGVRDTVPLVPADVLGTPEHPFGQSYRHVSEREIERIVAVPDPVQRNLRITQAYHDLKMSMTFLIGRKNVNWCAFATWASRTAGHFIRGDYIPGLVQSYLDQVKSFHNAIHTAHRMVARLHRNALLPHSVLVASIERAARQISEHLAHGNLIVFAEIAPLFARMHEEFRGATTHDERAVERFLGRLRPGHVLEGGQDLLRNAIRAYYRAMFEREPKKKAELILLANNSIGYHEQTRLQEDIHRSLNAPIAATIMRAAHERAREVSRGRLPAAMDRVIDHVLAPFSGWLQRSWANVATRWLMRMDMPDRVLELGRDVSHPELVDMFPPELTTIDNPELRALLYELDFSPNSTRGSACSNWADLAERMNFVVDFFRTYQQDKSLLQEPFAEHQIQVIRDGGIPGGAL